MNHRPEPPVLRDAETFRSAGHRLIDRMADFLAGVDQLPVSTSSAPHELARRFSAPLPRTPRPEGEVWDAVWEQVVGDSIHLQSPMYMGHQVAPPLPHAALADALVSLLNQSVAVWEMSPTGTLVEAQVVRWLLQLLGYPASGDGTLCSGGSAANLTALLAAREACFPGSWAAGVANTPELARAAILVSPHAHYCVERAVGMMGLGNDAMVMVPERDGRMDPEALAALVPALRKDGRIPFAVAATAGSTATGLFDPLEEIANVTRREGLWLHVDGAHGASFLLSDRLRHHLRGIEHADSVAWDPHKMMWMPISTGAVFVREHRHLDAALQQSAPYLFHPRAGEARSLDTGRRTLQCSRRFDALKLWVCLQHHGADFFGQLLETTAAATESLYRKLEARADWEPAHRPESNILCFRHLTPAVRAADPATQDAFQAALRERYNASGEGWMTTTVLGGRRVLRVTLMNPETGDEHLERMLDGVERVGREV